MKGGFSRTKLSESVSFQSCCHVKTAEEAIDLGLVQGPLQGLRRIKNRDCSSSPMLTLNDNRF